MLWGASSNKEAIKIPVREKESQGAISTALRSWSVPGAGVGIV